MTQFLRSLALWPLLAVAACSGGSGTPSSASGTARDLDLIVNTGAATEAKLVSRVSIVSLEDAASALTDNLLTAEADLTLADPAGELSFLRMRNAPAGTYVAVNVLFATLQVTAYPTTGAPFAVDLPRRDFRIALSRPMVLQGDAQAWFSLHHDGPIALERTATGWSWTPNMVAQPAEAELVRGVDVRVLSFDVQRRLIDGLLLPSETPVVLQLARAITLLRDGNTLDLDAFFAALRPGDVMRLDGWLDEWRNIAVTTGWIDTDGDEHRGRKSEVRGEIVELLPERAAFVLLVQEVRKDRAGLPPERPLRLTVRTGERTRIKWVPRHGRHRGHLDYEALRVGMRVDVEWHGPAPERALTAHKIDILEAAARPVLRELHGTVRQVDVPARTLTLDLSGGRELRVGDRSLRSVTLRVTDDSILVRRNRGQLELLTLDEIAVGASAQALTRLEGDVAQVLLLRLHGD